MNRIGMRLLATVLCSSVGATPGLADDWPQWGGPKRDGVWRESGIVETLPSKLQYKWKTPIGAGYAGPAVVGDRVYVTDRLLGRGEQDQKDPFDRGPIGGAERVLALDGQDGRIVWK